MNKFSVILLVTGAFALNGCAYLGTTSKSYTAGSTGRLFVWDSDYSAGVGKDNVMCVQGAKTATATSANGAIDAASEVTAGFGLSQKVTAINPSNPQTTYASDAYFSICQLAMNNPSLTAANILTMFIKASDTALKISSENKENTAFASPDLVNFVQDVLSEKGVDMSREEIKEKLEEKADPAAKLAPAPS